MISNKGDKYKPAIQPHNMIGDKAYSKNGRYEWILGTDRNGKLMWIEGPLQPKTR